jgi:hypothetical protein
MNSLLIKDLSLTEPLDRNAASAVRGGILTIPVEPDGGNGSGPLVMPPSWAMPAMPALPDFFALLPGSGWCGTPAPQAPRVPISRPPSDPALLQ